MQIIKSFFISLLLFIPFLKTYASGLKDSVSVGYDFYGDNSDVQVYSPTFAFMKTISKHWLVGFKMRIDAISAASIRNGASPKRVDTVAGATDTVTFGDIRYAPTLLMSYDDGLNAMSFGGYYSTEDDYDGKAFFINYVRQLNSDNTAVGIGFSQSSDSWRPIFKRNLPKDYRDEQKIDISINQLLTPKSSIQFVYSHMLSKGFLSSPYQYVLQKNFAKFEKYPDNRSGDAFAFKGVYLINEENSMNYSYRFYTDDWDITSHTIGAEWLHDFSEDLILGSRVRFYSQTKSNFAKDVGDYKINDDYFATDFRMSAFSSIDVGLPLIYFYADYKISMSIDYYQTSNNDYVKLWQGEDNLKFIYTSFSIDYDF